jgi:hypothetical protein
MKAIRYLAAAIAGSLLTLGCTASAATSTTGPCPSAFGQYVSCVQMPANTSTPMVGQQISTGPNSDPGTPWMVTDASGAPMAWVNLYGIYSFGNGGKDAGGLICVTYNTSAGVACLTPQGTLQLRPAGPAGPTGAMVTLTARDIRYLHWLEKVNPKP